MEGEVVREDAWAWGDSEELARAWRGSNRGSGESRWPVVPQTRCHALQVLERQGCANAWGVGGMRGNWAVMETCIWLF